MINRLSKSALLGLNLSVMIELNDKRSLYKHSDRN